MDPFFLFETRRLARVVSSGSFFQDPRFGSMGSGIEVAGTMGFDRTQRRIAFDEDRAVKVDQALARRAIDLDQLAGSLADFHLHNHARPPKKTFLMAASVISALL